MQRLLSLCVVSSSSPSSFSSSEQCLSNMHHRMMIVQFLVVPFVRSLTNAEVFIEAMTSTYQDVIDNRSLFQWCRDAVEVQGNGSTRTQEEDPPTIALSFALIECAYHTLNKETMSTRLLSPTPDWFDVKTSTTSSPDVVPQKTLNVHLVTHCRKHSQGVWELKRKQNTPQQQHYSLHLRQIAFNCLTVMVLQTQTKANILAKLLLTPKYFEQIGVIHTTQPRSSVEEEDELSVGTNFKTTVWDASSPGKRASAASSDGGGAIKIASSFQEWESNSDKGGSLRYLSDQYLAGSSLSSEVLSSSSRDGDVLEEATSQLMVSTDDMDIDDEGDEDDKDDKNDKDAVMHNANEEAEEAEETSSSNTSSTTTVLPLSKVSGLERVELDSFNRNPTMEYFVHLIDVLDAKNKRHEFHPEELWSIENTVHPDNVLRQQVGRPMFRIAKDQNRPPAWMNNLRSIMVSNTHPMESRMFVLKLLMHRPTAFAPFAALFIRPVLTLAVLMDVGKQPERGFHYLLRDCCRLLVRNKDRKSQYIGPYWKTCVHHW